MHNNSPAKISAQIQNVDDAMRQSSWYLIAFKLPSYSLVFKAAPRLINNIAQRGCWYHYFYMRSFIMRLKNLCAEMMETTLRQY